MPNLENWFFRYNAWSYSKHRLFDLCKRSFYYRYIGTALKESLDFDIYKLKRLKDLNSKYALEGLLIHGVIENQIGQHYIGRDLNEDGAKAQFVQRVEQYRKTARDTLTEFYNGLPDNGSDRALEVGDRDRSLEDADAVVVPGVFSLITDTVHGSRW